MKLHKPERIGSFHPASESPCPPVRSSLRSFCFMQILLRALKQKDGVVIEYGARPEKHLSDFFDGITEQDLHQAISEFYQEARERLDFFNHRKSVSQSLPEVMGVYGIKCKKNGKWYVGASRNVRKRVFDHFTQMVSQRVMASQAHPARYDCERFGFQSFVVELLEIVEDIDILAEREMFHINRLNAIRRGYNTQNPHQSNWSWKTKRSAEEVG